MKKITINFTPQEMEILKAALSQSGLRTMTELVRYLVTKYTKENAK